ncbi:unnamed protein product [Scytosiphon promiscuus]
MSEPAPLSTVMLVCAGFGVLAFISGSAENIWRKVKLAGVGAVHMLLSKDKKFKPEVDSSKVRFGPTSARKRIIFLRHGESEWNEVFNRGFGPSFLVRLISAIVREVMMLSTRDSVFFDSPLSNTGIKQTQELIRFLQKSPDSFSRPEVADAVTVLRGGGGSTLSSVVVTSNLRRAIATGLITLWERLRGGDERYLVHSALQEMTFNVDGISLLEKGETPDAALAKELGGNVVFDAEFNAGTKGLGYTGMKRMKALAEWATQRPEETVICVGHSLYFRSFFRCFLPQSTVHDAKKKKMVNCGVVAFTLDRGEYNGEPAYKIAPESIVSVYGGFK